MKFFGFIWRRILSLATTLLVLVLLLVLFIGYRIVSHDQQDDASKVQTKGEYLQQIASSSPDLGNAPNIVFVLYDDMGYGDIGAGVTNPEMIKTPHIDQLAAAGVTLSDFHSPAAVCTPARAGYLTGRLPPRAGLPYVVFPTDSKKSLLFHALISADANLRLPAEEITLANILSAAGYATGMVGKWHLGDRSPSLPNDMGFDSYFGALYSNDMEPFAFYRNREIAVEAPADQRYMTETYTAEVTRFIEENAGQPFFMYFAHNFPHDPLWVRDERSGKSDAGLYGDVLEELDDSIGAIVNTLAKAGVMDNTLIVISSDNGPWYLGGAGNQRGRKGNTFEGGMRVPFIAHWPEHIAPGREETAMAMGTDLLPTVLDILQLPAPGDRSLDGRSILPLLTEGSDTPHDYLYYYAGETLMAVRDQRFKYRAPAFVHYGPDDMRIAAGVPQKEWLFDLENDPLESYDTSDRYPEELQRLRKAFKDKQQEMATNLRGWR